MRSMVPLNFVNPPSWLPVTFEPVNSIFELSGVIGSDTAAAVNVFAELAAETFDGSAVCAFGLLKEGSSQPNIKIVDDNSNKANFCISGLSSIENMFQSAAVI